MKLVIQTQYAENYGDANKPYWKFKGGETYIVQNLNANQVERIISHGIPTLKALIEYDNPMSREYIVNHEILDDDVVVTEDYETPYILSWENNTWVARHMQQSSGEFRKPILCKVVQYTMAMKGEKIDLTTSYVVEGGQVIDYKDIMTYCDTYIKSLQKA